jgi:hypothetical protein
MRRIVVLLVATAILMAVAISPILAAPPEEPAVVADAKAKAAPAPAPAPAPNPKAIEAVTEAGQKSAQEAKAG